jgi:hypothetical protein
LIYTYSYKTTMYRSDHRKMDTGTGVRFPNIKKTILELPNMHDNFGNFGSLNNVEVQFDDQEAIQPIGDMGPFSSVMITPPDMNFDSIIVMTAK